MSILSLTAIGKKLIGHGTNIAIYMKQELTLNELIEKIKLKMDPYMLLEALNLEWEELVDALADTIEEQYENLLEEIDEDDE